MSNWNRVTAGRPCDICGKSDWCSVSADARFVICRRVDNGQGRGKRDVGGADYWVYTRVGPAFALEVTPRTPPTPRPKALGTHVDSVYRELLSRLDLAPIDRRALEARGLNDQVIQKNLYRSFPRAGRAELARGLATQFGRKLILETPGFIKELGSREGFDLTLSGPEGLLIPVRDSFGKIIALKIRRRGEAGPKYLYLSSASRGGAGPGAPVHVPLFDGDTTRVRLTEGELKADVATALGVLPTLSIAGVSAWRQALPVLATLGAKTCRLAFDMDLYSNAFVAKALREAARAINEAGFGLEFETWPRQFKGIDECLAARRTTRVLSNEAALDAIMGIAGEARAG